MKILSVDHLGAIVVEFEDKKVCDRQVHFAANFNDSNWAEAPAKPEKPKEKDYREAMQKACANITKDIRFTIRDLETMLTCLEEDAKHHGIDEFMYTKVHIMELLNRAHPLSLDDCPFCIFHRYGGDHSACDVCEYAEKHGGICSAQNKSSDFMKVHDARKAMREAIENYW